MKRNDPKMKPSGTPLHDSPDNHYQEGHDVFYYLNKN